MIKKKSLYVDTEKMISNHTTEEILRECKNVRTLEEFERDFMKELERMAKKYGVK